jgi:hypothetical protein
MALHEQQFAAFDGKTDEHKLREIADREEIRELVARYALGIARGHQVGEMFTDDGIFIQRLPGEAPQEFRGRAALLPMYAQVAETVRPIPMIHNHIIDIDGDEARGQCSIELRMSAGGKSLIGSGYYEDVYRRVNGRWRFAKRDATIFHMCSLQEGWAGK